MSANVPELRFSGFADPWEQRKLGEVCTFDKGRGYSKADICESGTPLVLYGRLYTQYETVIESVDTYAESKDGSLYSRGGEVIVPGSGETAEDIAVASHISSSGILIGGDLNVITPQPALDSTFIAIGITNGSPHEQLAMKAQGKSVVHIHNDDIAGVVFSYPSLPEQRAVGALFSRLDSLIALHQRKHNQLSVLKGSLLEGMFPKPGSDVPELRFSGFADPWEQRKLGDITRRVTRKNENLESQLPLTISAQYGLVDQTEFFNNRVASSDLSGYYLLHKGEFAYNKSTSGDSPWGAVKRLERYEKGCVSTLYIVFEALGINPQFLVTYYETDRWYKGVQAIAAEGARNHGLLNIAPSDFFDTELTVPSSEAEQRAVGALFSRLDSLIALHQRKLEKLRALKQSLLQKMFV